MTEKCRVTVELFGDDGEVYSEVRTGFKGRHAIHDSLICAIKQIEVIGEIRTDVFLATLCQAIYHEDDSPFNMLGSAYESWLRVARNEAFEDCVSVVIDEAKLTVEGESDDGE